MKKCSIYMLLSLAAFLAVLSACGDGEIVDLSNGSSEYREIMGSDGPLGNLTEKGAFIGYCADNKDEDECVPLYEQTQQQSSSSEPEGESSSSDPGHTGESSSSAVIGGESSSSTPLPSSSSVYIPPPPSSASCTDDCAEVPTFTCTFTPATNVVSGDESTLKINVTAGNADGCTTRAYVEFGIPNAMGTDPCAARPTIADDAKGWTVTTSGKIDGSCVYTAQNGTTTNRTGSWPWPTSGAVSAVKGEITCGSGSTINSKSANCAISLTAPPKPAIETGGRVSFVKVDYSSGSSSYFYIGTTPEITHNITITNNDAAKCGEVQTRIEGDTKAAGAVKAVAYAICRGSEHELSTATATVAPNPTLTGTCSWSKNPTTSAKGAVPSGVSLSNGYGRCGSVADGALPLSAYSGGAYASWPATGLVAAGKYSVSTNVSCVSTQSNCPELTVNAGSDHALGSETAVTQIPSGLVAYPVHKDECVDITLNWGTTTHFASVKLICTAKPQFTGNKNTLTLTRGATSCGEKATAEGDYHVSAECSLGTIKSGINEWTVCLSSTTNGVSNPTFECSVGQ